MTGFGRPLALFLAVAAVVLFGYVYYAEQQKSQLLEEDLALARADLLAYQTASENRQIALNGFFGNDENVETIRALALTASRAARDEQAEALAYDLQRYMVDQGVAVWEVQQIADIVAETDADARRDIAESLTESTSIALPEVQISATEAFATVSTLVALLGSIGSALGSAFLFMTGGARRRIEEDMLAVDLEKQRVELAKMKFEAREAIAAQEKF